MSVSLMQTLLGLGPSYLSQAVTAHTPCLQKRGTNHVRKAETDKGLPSFVHRGLMVGRRSLDAVHAKGACDGQLLTVHGRRQRTTID